MFMIYNKIKGKNQTLMPIRTLVDQHRRRREIQPSHESIPIVIETKKSEKRKYVLFY